MGLFGSNIRLVLPIKNGHKRTKSIGHLKNCKANPQKKLALKIPAKILKFV